MDLSQFFNLGITEQQAKLGIEKLMQGGISLPQKILDAYNLRKQRKALDFFINQANGSKILVESLFSMIASKIRSN
jgi:hypothetical protein